MMAEEKRGRLGLVVERTTSLSLRARGRAMGAPLAAVERAPADVPLLTNSSLWNGCCCLDGEPGACTGAPSGVLGTESSARRHKETF